MSPPLTLAAVLAVAVGGAAGSLARYLASVWLMPVTGNFPWATLVVNVVGAFLIGWFARHFATPDANHVWRLALTTGFCGGFTTFSTMSAETVTLVQEGRVGRAAAYIALSLVLGLSATVAGLAVGSPDT